MLKKKSVKVLSITIILMALFTIGSFAAKNEKPRIYADTVVCDSDEILIPIKIDNNSGIAGFGFVFTYDDEVFTPKEVIRSKNFSSGMLNDSISTSKSNSFEVVWSGTSNNYTEGEVFILKFNVNKEKINDSIIKISCNKNNTFDEKINEIEFLCEDIEIESNSDEKVPFNIFIWFKNIINKIVAFFRSWF